MSFDGELTTPSLRHRFSEMSVRLTLAISGTITTNSTEFSTKFAVIYKIICQAKIKNIVHELRYYALFLLFLKSTVMAEMMLWMAHRG